MVTIRQVITVDAAADEVWDAVRDVGAVHQRLAPGFVVSTELEDGVRVVTFANGMVVRELIVSVDDDLRRLAYASVGGQATHHHASFEVRDAGPGKAELVWTTDLLPEELAEPISQMLEAGAAAIQKALGSSSSANDKSDHVHGAALSRPGDALRTTGL